MKAVLTLYPSLGVRASASYTRKSWVTILANANHIAILCAPIIGVIGLYRNRYKANKDYKGQAKYSDSRDDLARS